MCYDLLRFSLCSSICAMACKLKYSISCLLVIALSPPPLHCSSQQNTPPIKHQTHFSLLGGLKESTHPLKGVCFNYLPETNIRVSFNNQPNRTTRTTRQDGGWQKAEGRIEDESSAERGGVRSGNLTLRFDSLTLRHGVRMGHSARRHVGEFDLCYFR